MVKWPKCAWCGSLDAFRCPMCHEFTCAECVTYVNMYPDPDEGRCEHEKFVPIEADNWNPKLTEKEFKELYENAPTS